MLFCLLCSLQPQTFLQSTVTPCREDIASTSETKPIDGEINSAACYLSKEQSTQLWTQIQQVRMFISY